MRKLYASILSIVLVSLFSGRMYSQSLDDISFGTDSTFEVVSWNIEWFPKSGSTTVDSVSKIIESLDVDLIGLQEIDDSTVCRQMVNNIEGYDLFMDNDWFGGLAYIYKTSTISIQSIYKIYDTSPYWNVFPRSPLVMELKFMEEDFIVINNHFKCCGDGILDMGNYSDEEFRRFEANSLLKQYIDANFSSSRVIVIGDLNDVLTDEVENNVFQLFLDDSVNYLFADDAIASGPSTDWSFPGWPSHLDHILITNEIFTEFSNPGSEIQTIKVDNFMSGGLEDYDYYISDHRPVGLKLKVNPTVASLTETSASQLVISPNPTNGQLTIDLTQFENETEIKIVDLNGKVIHSKVYQSNQLADLAFEGAAGMYFLKVRSGNEEFVIKLMKE